MFSLDFSKNFAVSRKFEKKFIEFEKIYEKF